MSDYTATAAIYFRETDENLYVDTKGAPRELVPILEKILASPERSRLLDGGDYIFLSGAEHQPSMVRGTHIRGIGVRYDTQLELFSSPVRGHDYARRFYGADSRYVDVDYGYVVTADNRILEF